MTIPNFKFCFLSFYCLFFQSEKGFVLRNRPSFSVCVPVKIEVNPTRVLAQNRQSILNGLIEFIKILFFFLRAKIPKRFQWNHSIVRKINSPKYAVVSCVCVITVSAHNLTLNGSNDILLC